MLDRAVYLIPSAIFLTVAVAVTICQRRHRRVGALGARGARRAVRLLAAGRPIDAIALVRDRTGASLSDARHSSKNSTDSAESDAQLSGRPPVTPTTSPVM